MIDDFLAERLNESQQSTFELHLDECDTCCAELQRRTADVCLWNDARNFLSSTDNCPTDTASVPAEQTESPVSADMLHLDFLAPTDDPHMLGRFGGYEISGVVGCGGMGIVLKGFDTALNRYAAIKVLAPHYASSGAARRRFAREAQAAAAVVHDNVIAIHGVDEFRGLPYLVMPYVRGESLQKRIDRDGTLNTAEILRIAMQIARGLTAAHDQGLVHRDIKPGNILLPENVERVLITDFGLARAADDASLTRSGVIAGTPQYMSPEQARGDGIDHRSDLFSLGSVMYTMCTGHPPFRAETSYGILRRITDNGPRPIREINPDVPAWLTGIIDRLLTKAPEKRFSSAKEIADLLEDCLAHVQQPMVVPLPRAVPGRQNRIRQVFRAKTIFVLCAAFFVTWAIWQMTGMPAAPNATEEPNLIVQPDKDKNADLLPQPPSSQGTGTPARPTNGKQELQVSRSAAAAETELQWEPGDDLNRLRQTIQELKVELSDPVDNLSAGQ